jgi:ABC-type glycerol-3-phosphate transport system substrate-binding protein
VRVSPNAKAISAALAMSMVAACEAPERSVVKPIRFMHAFTSAESAELETVLARWRDPVEPTLLPFARGLAVVQLALRADDVCPDLVRIDATWLPALAADGLVTPPPAALADRDWLPEARGFATWRGQMLAVPLSQDGLVLVRSANQAMPATIWPPHDLDQLEAAARSLTTRDRYGLGLRVDGYWLVGFLRARGADVADGDRHTLGIDSDHAEQALDEMASLFATGVAAPPSAPGIEAESETTRFRRGAIAILATGPWAFASLADVGSDGLDGLTVDGWPGAPRGGQALVVPTCARQPDRAWHLAAELTSPAVAARWSRQLGVVPTTRTGLERAGALAQATYRALAVARPLPQHRISSTLFDDLSPAVAAVVAGDATAAEAIAGTRRAWQRTMDRVAP